MVSFSFKVSRRVERRERWRTSCLGLKRFNSRSKMRKMSRETMNRVSKPHELSHISHFTPCSSKVKSDVLPLLSLFRTPLSRLSILMILSLPTSFIYVDCGRLQGRETTQVLSYEEKFGLLGGKVFIIRSCSTSLFRGEIW